MIQFRRQRAAAGRFVNSLLGKNYGSNRVDCRQPLRNWAHRVVYLRRQTDAAGASIDNHSVTESAAACYDS
jgi:hypothetical protein